MTYGDWQVIYGLLWVGSSIAIAAAILWAIVR